MYEAFEAIILISNPSVSRVLIRIYSAAYRCDAIITADTKALTGDGRGGGRIGVHTFGRVLDPALLTPPLTRWVNYPNPNMLCLSTSTALPPTALPPIILPPMAPPPMALPPITALPPYIVVAVSDSQTTARGP